MAEKKRKDVSVERQPAKKSRPALKKGNFNWRHQYINEILIIIFFFPAPISKSIVSGDDSDSENEFDPPKQAKKTASTSTESKYIWNYTNLNSAIEISLRCP